MFLKFHQAFYPFASPPNFQAVYLFLVRFIRNNSTNCIAAIYGSRDFFINILGQLAGTKNNNTMVKHPFVKNMKIADPPEYDEKNQKTYA